MHDVRFEVPQQAADGSDPTGRHAHLPVPGHRETGDPLDPRACDLARTIAPCAGGDDDRLIAALGQVVQHPEEAVGDTVHLREERLRDHCDSHDYQNTR